MTQLEAARSGAITAAMQAAAAAEGVPAEAVRAALAAGTAVLPANPAHTGLRPAVAGRAFRTKVNANIGFSPERSSLAEELHKLTVALEAGADFVMDLSVGADLDPVRRAILDASPVAIGTVPVYEALSRVGGRVNELTGESFLDVIRDQARQGVDFMTLHAGLLREHVPLAVKRLLGIASRGGAVLAEWMSGCGRQNPLYERWDDIMAVCREHDVTVSLGDGLRPGCLADASDEAQFAELDVLGRLVRRCRAAGVQVMVEGPGHVPYDQIAMNMERQQRVCDGAPFYVLGPLVTDIAAAHDHVACAIGATAAAFHGACLICYVTPAEHLHLPTCDDVRAGIHACRVAAHAADVARGLPGARQRDDAMSRARAALDWEGQFAQALDSRGARERFMAANRGAAHGSEQDHCSMCGREFCAMRVSRKLKAEAARSAGA
jgi:phosphomethylpyrimidine synthase